MNIDALNTALPPKVFADLPYVIGKYGVLTNRNRLAHFLAQCSHESANFTRTVENLNYSAEGLLKTFPKYFNRSIAETYARKPELIANHVYSNRMGNGSSCSGDGFKYRGRGFIQLTGRANYQEFTDWLTDQKGLSQPSIHTDCVEYPTLVSDVYPLTSALWFFIHNTIFALCDNGISENTNARVTKAVNGGLNGVDERYDLLLKYAQLIKE